MAGLSSLIASSNTSNTELPSWYSTAQQNAVDAANIGLAQTPQATQTVGQNAIKTLSGPDNPFTQAQSTLNQVATGAANPWQTDESGQVSPNTNTALGGLFAAQNQYLNQILPQTVAPTVASGIASGNFGSLRSQTAENTARASALAQLQSNQQQAALNAQTQAIQAGSALGNVGTQNIDQSIKAGQYQQTSPFAGAAAYGTVLGNLGSVGSKKTDTTNLSPLAQASAVGTLLNSPTASAALSKLGVGSLSDVYNKLFSGAASPSGGGSGGGGSGGGGTFSTADGGKIQLLPSGQKILTDASGKQTFFDSAGNDVTREYTGTGTSDEILQDNNTIPAGDTTDYGGHDTSWIDNQDWGSYDTPSEE